MTLAVVVIFLILTVTTNSWFEPVLYLTVMGVAIVLNKGTNLFIGRISFDEQCVGGPCSSPAADGLFDFLKLRVCEGKGKRTGFR